MPAEWIVPAAIAGVSLLANAASARRQRKENRKFAEYQNLVNSQQLDKQLDYNAPKAQMSRFQDAGLNPNLMYGQGNPGNQSEALKYPDVKQPDYQAITANLGPLLNQSLMTQSQTQAIDAKTRQTAVLTRLNKLQADVMEKNPLLDAGGYAAIIESLKASAEIKASESKIKGIESNWYNMEGIGRWQGMKLGEAKLFKELELLEQRFNLGGADLKLKAEVLTSKEFQNAIIEVQKKFMVDGDITPQHILQFIQLLLLKSF